MPLVPIVFAVLLWGLHALIVRTPIKHRFAKCLGVAFGWTVFVVAIRIVFALIGLGTEVFIFWLPLLVSCVPVMSALIHYLDVPSGKAGLLTVLTTAGTVGLFMLFEAQ